MNINLSGPINLDIFTFLFGPTNIFFYIMAHYEYTTSMPE